MIIDRILSLIVIATGLYVIYITGDMAWDAIIEVREHITNLIPDLH